MEREPTGRQSRRPRDPLMDTPHRYENIGKRGADICGGCFLGAGSSRPRAALREVPEDDGAS